MFPDKNWVEKVKHASYSQLRRVKSFDQGKQIR